MTTIIITGCNRGIGLEIARAANAKSWRVIGSARKLEQATSAMAGFENFMALEFDVSDHETVKTVAAELEEPIDVLINNAGIIGPEVEDQTSLNMDFDGFAKTLAVNTMAPLAVAQAFLPNLKRSANARILTVSSQMSQMGGASFDRIAYRASKSAVNKVMQGLAYDLKPENIAVGLINPGWVRTDMGGSNADLSSEEVGAGIVELANGFSMAQSGKFWKWSGEECEF